MKKYPKLIIRTFGAGRIVLNSPFTSTYRPAKLKVDNIVKIAESEWAGVVNLKSSLVKTFYYWSGLFS